MTDTQTTHVPSFLDDEDDDDRKLAIVCSKGSLDMAYPGLILAYAALEDGIEVHLFFTFWGFEIINKKTWDHLHFSALGNPATHMPAWLSGFPGMETVATKMMEKQIEEIDIPHVDELVTMIHEMGGNLWACKMSADMQHLDEDDLYEGVDGIISAGEFIALSKGAQTMFI